jgi:PAS domain S-box-containing protein
MPQSKDDEALRSLIRTMPVMVVAINENDLFIEWNHECERVTGYSAQEMILNPDPSKLLYPDSEYFATLREFWKEKHDVYYNKVWKIRCKDGTDKDISWSNISGEHHIAGWSSWAVGLDVSELTTVTEKLTASENRFRSVYNSAETGFALCDPKGILQDVNPAFAQMLGYLPEDIIGLSFMELTHPDERDVEFARFNAALQNNSTNNVTLKKRYLHKDGQSIWVKLNTTFVRDKDGVPTVALGIIQNISDELRFQEELEEHKEYLYCAAKVAEILLTEQNFDSAINNSFSLLGATSNADRIYLFENEYNETTGEWFMSQTYEWVKGGITKHIDNEYLQHLKYCDANPRWKDVMLQRGFINGIVKDFPTAEREVLEPQGVLALLAVPIYLQDDWYGFIGFDNCTKARVYNKAEESMLQSAAIAIGGAIQREKINRQLIEAKTKAEEMNKLKSIFLANMSHELRTPLIGILGFAEILSQEIDDPYFKKLTDNIYKAGQRLSESLSLILDLSRIEADKLTLNLEDVDLIDVVLESTGYFDQEIIKKGLYLNIDTPEEIPLLKSDKRMLLTIVDNLLSNAIKFTHEGGIDIIVKAEKTSSSPVVNLILRDTGIGISQDFMDVIFDEFRQVSEGLNRSYEGVGLGLTIIKKFTEKLGGTLSLNSLVGVGTTFTISFPVLPARTLPLFHDGVEKVESEPGTQNLKRILLVDDDVPTHTLVKIFSKSIANIDFAFNGEEAIRIAMRRKIDLVLLDINLGNAPSGISVLKKMKQMKEFRGVPILACTAYNQASDKERFNEEGFDGYISKPLIKADFQRTIKKYLFEQEK